MTGATMNVANVDSNAVRPKEPPHVALWRWFVSVSWLVVALFLAMAAMNNPGYQHVCLLTAFAALGAGLGTPFRQGISGAVVSTVVCGGLYLLWELFSQ